MGRRRRRRAVVAIRNGNYYIAMAIGEVVIEREKRENQVKLVCIEAKKKKRWLQCYRYDREKGCVVVMGIYFIVVKKRLFLGVVIEKVVGVVKVFFYRLSWFF